MTGTKTIAYFDRLIATKKQHAAEDEAERYRVGVGILRHTEHD